MRGKRGGLLVAFGPQAGFQRLHGRRIVPLVDGPCLHLSDGNIQPFDVFVPDAGLLRCTYNLGELAEEKSLDSGGYRRSAEVVIIRDPLVLKRLDAELEFLGECKRRRCFFACRAGVLVHECGLRLEQVAKDFKVGGVAARSGTHGVQDTAK